MYELVHVVCIAPFHFTYITVIFVNITLQGFNTSDCFSPYRHETAPVTAVFSRLTNQEKHHHHGSLFAALV